MSVIDDEDRIWQARCAEAPDGWPFDADQGDPLTARRIAVTHSHPGWRYLVAFDRESTERPTDHEVDLLVSYLEEYKARWYNDGYRRQSWQSGPMYLPTSPDMRDWHARRGDEVLGPLGLAALMDHIHTIGDEPSKHWVAWKAARPEVFAP